MATNTVNGKRYVGATSRGLTIRKRGHLTSARTGPNCPAFHAAIRRYGAMAFEWKIVATASSREELYELEVRLIAELRPEYNVAPGGKGGTAALILNAIDATRVSVVCLDDGRRFRSIVEAANAFGLRSAVVSLSIRRGHRSGGFYFIRSKSIIDASARQKMIAELDAARFERLSKRKSLPVVCSNNTKFRNMRFAGEAHNLTAERIGQLCRSGGTTRSGLSFSYLETP